MRSQIGKSIKPKEPTTNAVRAGQSECWAPLNFLDGGCDASVFGIPGEKAPDECA